MFKIVLKFVLLILFFAAPAIAPAQASWEKTLVTINGVEYTAQDYLDWWKIWREKDMAFFDTPQKFIDFHLLAEEGKTMEYDLTPEFKRKIRIFLTVRALAELKYEEVDTKIDVTEDEIKAYFKKHYTPLWFIQILGYDDQEKAKAVTDAMQGFAGQKAGRLVFADYSGVKKDEGGPLHYQEIEIYPAMLNKSKETWLDVLTNLKEGNVSEPFFLESFNHHLVVRLDEVTNEPSQDFFNKHRQTIKRELVDRERARLNNELIERLKEKYHVKVDEELVESLNTEDDYPEEILEKPVISWEGENLTAEALIRNVEEQRRLRKGLSEENLKQLVINFFISQSVVDMEALSRHYENKQPLKRLYRFYIDNNLRKFLLNDMKERIDVSDEEIKEHYENNLASYTQPGKYSYAIIQGEIEVLEDISREISRGENFFDVAKTYALDANIKTVYDDSIKDKQLATALNDMQKGEVSEPFPYQTTHAIVRLLKKISKEHVPLVRVKEDIEKSLREEKFIAAKQNYLEKVREMSEIEVDHNLWLKIKKEYKNEEK